MRPLLSLLLLSGPALALDIEREEYKIVGWNNACSVAVERYAYPVLAPGAVKRYNSPVAGEDLCPIAPCLNGS